MRIIQIIGAWPPPGGAVHGQIPGLAAQLRNIGMRCDVVSVSPDARMVLWRSPEAQTWTALDSAGCDRVLREADLLHAHGCSVLEVPVVRATLLERAGRLVISPHGAVMPDPWRRPTLAQRFAHWLRLDRRLYRRAASVHAALPAEAEFLKRHGYNARVYTLPIGVAPPPDEDRASEPRLADPHPQLAGRRFLLVLGPIDPQEGLVPLLKACEEVVDSAGEWQLVLAGSRSRTWFEMIQAAIERRRLSQRVTFVIDPDRGQQDALLNRCSAVVHPALRATTAVSVLEGLIRGKPCAVSRHCGLTAMVQSGGGWECEPRRGDLARVLADVVASSQQRLASMGARAREWVMSHGCWQVLAPQYRDYYASLVG